jgi:hypothetical protein
MSLKYRRWGVMQVKITLVGLVRQPADHTQGQLT